MVACGPGVLLVQLEVEWLPVVADQQQSILHTPSGQKRRFPFLSGQVLAGSLADDGKRLRGTRSELDVVAESVSYL